MTRDQKERYVIELYKQDKTVREIVHLAHMSPRDVVAIINKYKKEVERENGQVEDNDDYNIKSKSKTTQAFGLFSEGKTPIDVVIALDLSPDEVQETYRQYLKLKDMHELVEVYDRMENYLPSLLELFRLIENKGFNKNDIIEVLRIINTGQLPAIKKNLQDLTYAEEWLENEIKKKKQQPISLGSEDEGIIL